jgi:hypothetical protein
MIRLKTIRCLYLKIRAHLSFIYIIKEFVQAKMSLINREFLFWKERGKERRVGGRAGGSAGRHILGYVRFWER